LVDFALVKVDIQGTPLQSLEIRGQQELVFLALNEKS
jgi:hypothetical protein